MKHLIFQIALFVALIARPATLHAQTNASSELVQKTIIAHVANEPVSKRVGPVSNVVIRDVVEENADSLAVLYTYKAGDENRIGLDHLVQKQSHWTFDGGSSGRIDNDSDMVIFFPELVKNKLYIAGYTNHSDVQCVNVRFDDQSSHIVSVSNHYFCSSVTNKRRVDLVSAEPLDAQCKVIHLNPIQNDMGWEAIENFTAYEDFVKQCIGPSVQKTVNEYYGEYRRISYPEMQIMSLHRLEKGSYWFDITVRVKTSKGSFNPPYGLDMITLTNHTKGGEFKVVKYVHRDVKSFGVKSQ